MNKKIGIGILIAVIVLAVIGGICYKVVYIDAQDKKAKNEANEQTTKLTEEGVLELLAKIESNENFAGLTYYNQDEVRAEDLEASKRSYLAYQNTEAGKDQKSITSAELKNSFLELFGSKIAYEEVTFPGCKDGFGCFVKYDQNTKTYTPDFSECGCGAVYGHYTDMSKVVEYVEENGQLTITKMVVYKDDTTGKYVNHAYKDITGLSTSITDQTLENEKEELDQYQYTFTREGDHYVFVKVTKLTSASVSTQEGSSEEEKLTEQEILELITKIESNTTFANLTYYGKNEVRAEDLEASKRSYLAYHNTKEGQNQKSITTEALQKSFQELFGSKITYEEVAFPGCLNGFGCLVKYDKNTKTYTPDFSECGCGSGDVSHHTDISRIVEYNEENGQLTATKLVVYKDDITGKYANHDKKDIVGLPTNITDQTLESVRDKFDQYQYTFTREGEHYVFVKVTKLTSAAISN